MLLTELSELLENLFSKLLAQSITEQEYRQKMVEALSDYDEKVRLLKETIVPTSTKTNDTDIHAEDTSADVHTDELVELDEFLDMDSIK